MTFKSLHTQEIPLLICNIWDAKSAQMAEELGFQSVGTSSAAIATILGYNDGEEMNFEELLFIVKRIMASTDLPVTVDMEAGYSRDPYTIVEHINKLANAGVVGINIEDSILGEERTLIDVDEFATMLRHITSNTDIFINVRTDTFLLGIEGALEKTLQRCRLYGQVGVHGIFIPCITTPRDIQAVTQATSLPVNVMCMPDLPDFQTLTKLGVKRISMGNFLFDAMYNHHSALLKTILQDQSFKAVF